MWEFQASLLMGYPKTKNFGRTVKTGQPAFAPDLLGPPFLYPTRTLTSLRTAQLEG